MNVKDFLDGALIGVVQTIVGHPLDTIKSLMQNNQTNNRLTLYNCYRGVYIPIFFSGIINSLQFGLFDSTKDTLGVFKASFFAGALSSVLITPHDYIKLNIQTNNYDNIKFKNIFKGSILTFFRESIAITSYFTIYFKVMEYLKCNRVSAETTENGLVKTDHFPFLIGGLCGCISWGVTYPIDTIKTRFQISTKKHIKQHIYSKNIWAGFSFCMYRAFLVNGVTFLVYDMIK